MRKLILLVLASMLAYYGFDGLTINKDLVEYSMENIEKKGIGDDRFIKLTGAYPTGEYVYHYDVENPNVANKIIFPLVSKKVFDKIEEGKTSKFPVKVLVKRSSAKFKRNCVASNSCIDDVIQQMDNYTVKGVVLPGLDDVDDETKELLNGSGLNIGNDVIFIEEDEEPKSNTKSILMLIGGIIGILLIIGSLFSNDEDEDE